MDEFCVIIPDRGDRPEFLNHCLFQMERQTVIPSWIYPISFPPAGPDVDLVPRIREGIQHAKTDGIDICYIIENDDYYPDDYFEVMDIQDHGFVGIPKTIYYNIFLRRYAVMEHALHSCLMCTGFRISALEGFTWPADDYISLDKEIWKFAANSQNKYLYVFPGQMPIGIKHGIGKCAGTGHGENFSYYTNEDPDGQWLKCHTRPKSYKFYNELISAKH